jgi:hypothetical protein
VKIDLVLLNQFKSRKKRKAQETHKLTEQQNQKSLLQGWIRPVRPSKWPVSFRALFSSFTDAQFLLLDERRKTKETNKEGTKFVGYFSKKWSRWTPAMT